MALTLQQQRDRIQKLMKTANNEDYLDLYQTLRSIQRDIVIQHMESLGVGLSEYNIEKTVDEVMEAFK